MTEFIYPLIFPLIGILVFMIYGGHFTNEYFKRDLKDEKEDGLDEKSHNKYKNNNNK